MNYFVKMPKDDRATVLDYLCRRHGWTRDKALEEAEAMEPEALAYIKVENRLANGREVGYDVFREFWKVS